MRSESGMGSLAVALACVCLSACSGETDSQGSGGAANATGGAANATGGATNATAGTAGVGGAVPPIAAVGLTVNLTQTASCPILTGIPDDIGNPPPDSANSEIGIRVEDGSEGVAVVCSVKAQTGGFFVVKATVASSDPAVAFSINGSVDTLGVGTAVIGLSTRALPADVLSPTNIPCTLQVVSNNGLAFKPGALWARFQCTSLVSPPTYNCAVSGETVLENCAN